MLKNTLYTFVSILLFSLLTQTSFPARAEADVIKIIIQKHEEKKKNGWSLSDWLETRDRMRLMDLWLALHSPSPYEFYLQANHYFADQDPGEKINPWQFGFAAYASIFGLEFQYETSPLSRWYGIFNLRIFGYYVQGTHITLQAGVRSNNRNQNRNAFLGGFMNIYIMDFFGVETLYRHFFESTGGSLGETTSGSRYELGAFLDFRALRIFGNYFNESGDLSFGGTNTLLKNRGVTLGTKLFF